MNTIRINDLEDGCLAFDLRELLDLLGDDAMDARWACEVQDFVPKEGALWLPVAYETAQQISGAILYQVASQTLQVIDGRFVATRNGEPWVILEAVDSGYWDVSTNDDAVLAKLSAHFRSVERVTT